MGRVPMVVPDLSLCNITYTNSIEVGNISVTVYSMYTVYLYINYCNYLCLNTTLYKWHYNTIIVIIAVASSSSVLHQLHSPVPQSELQCLHLHLTWIQAVGSQLLKTHSDPVNPGVSASKPPTDDSPGRSVWGVEPLSSLPTFGRYPALLWWW